MGRGTVPHSKSDEFLRLEPNSYEVPVDFVRETAKISVTHIGSPTASTPKGLHACALSRHLTPGTRTAAQSLIGNLGPTPLLNNRDGCS